MSLMERLLYNASLFKETFFLDYQVNSINKKLIKKYQ